LGELAGGSAKTYRANDSGTQTRRVSDPRNVFARN
jgi:hypothetical protein